MCTYFVFTFTSPEDMSDFGFHRVDVDNNGQVTFEEEWNAIISHDTDGMYLTRTFGFKGTKRNRE